jgi:hypothetical protein
VSVDANGVPLILPLQDTIENTVSSNSSFVVRLRAVQNYLSGTYQAIAASDNALVTMLIINLYILFYETRTVR